MHWVDEYGPELYAWRTDNDRGRVSYYRRIGVAEGLFDLDGIDLEGRADCHSLVTIRTAHRITHDSITNVWAYLRLKHAMLMAKSLPGSAMPYLKDSASEANTRYFCITPPATREEAIASASATLTFVCDWDRAASSREFYHHVLNSSRKIDPGKCLAHLFVLPGSKKQGGDGYLNTFLFVYSHSITDGLTMFAWASHFSSLVSQAAQARVADFFSTFPQASMHYHLHPAQESLYAPVYPTNVARARWTWAITRILRHVTRPLGTPFPNPLRRCNDAGFKLPQLPPIYDHLIDYARSPPVRTGMARVELCQTHTDRLKTLCRQIHVSVGAGLFALLAIASMRCRELFAPDELNEDMAKQAGSSSSALRLWITGFPLDCRPFLSAPVSYDGMTLGFSWGHALPFLGSDIPFERRFRVLARAANKQLGIYQKGERGVLGGAGLGLKARDQTLRALYLTTAERHHMKYPAAVRASKEQQGWRNPQGELGAWVTGGFTHGISSLGSASRFLADMKEKGALAVEEPEDSPAEMIDYEWGVRARENEFLVGVLEKLGGGMMFCTSYDEGAMDPKKVDIWTEVLRSLLATEDDA